MLIISFKASFLRQMNKLDDALREEAIEKIDLFKEIPNHKFLKVHKLHSPLVGLFSFSVNYKTRIVFQYISKDEITFLSIGDHAIYN